MGPACGDCLVRAGCNLIPRLAGTAPQAKIELIPTWPKRMVSFAPAPDGKVLSRVRGYPDQECRLCRMTFPNSSKRSFNLNFGAAAQSGCGDFSTAMSRRNSGRSWRKSIGDDYPLSLHNKRLGRAEKGPGEIVHRRGKPREQACF